MEKENGKILSKKITDYTDLKDFADYTLLFEMLEF